MKIRGILWPKHTILKRHVFIIVLGLCCVLAGAACKSSEKQKRHVGVLEYGEVEEAKINQSFDVLVPCEGNSWVVDGKQPEKQINSASVISNWNNSNNKIRTYFYATKTGNIKVGLKGIFTTGATLKVTLGEQTKVLHFSGSESVQDYELGNFQINKKGYHYVELEGLKKEGATFGAISHLLLGQGAWANNIDYIKEKWFYWGRRGPSVHMAYQKPPETNVKWFYNEVTVPKGNDVIGSYFMANGFSYGYFGMQVISETERRILFSVWSAFDTQDPSEIPEEYAVDVLGNGKNVHVGLFGNEGSGAQTYLVYNWKPDTTYKFLLKGETNVAGSIDYTAYFFAPEVGQWKLIASLRRPKSTKKHIDGMYSFLENFSTEHGHIEREVLFGNQWVRTTKGEWLELNKAKYTADATARAGARLDYDGGTKDNAFYLRNCGFFNDNTAFDVKFERTANGIAPNIDLESLKIN